MATKNHELLNVLQMLVETPGPSGSEHLIRSKIEAEIRDHVDEVYTDALGNLIAKKGSKKEGGRRVMVSSHVDEIGLMVTHVDENGFARFITIGGVSPLTCLGGRVLFMNGTQGVIGMERLEANEQPSLAKLFIDTGATSKEDSKIGVGDVAGFERPFMNMGKRLVAKSMDDRAAVAVAIQALKAVESTPNEIFFVFSVQEEVGLRGAITAAYGVDPEVGIAVDVTRTGDTPKGVKMEVALGKGPAIKVRDSSFIADPRVVNWMVEEAKAQGLPYQMEVLEAGGTDGAAIQRTRAGVPAGCLSIPCRYIHSPSEMVDVDDLQQSVSLLTGLLSKSIEI
ncbi:MAG: M42 family metallopeptidase [Anaerolineaceae bacterium]|nr:M42 family metallopeptidase [Anaerolineaceae bacterium]MDD4042624.1 M42 family metallopeptidase [Anaerolineaceae bacterium]